MRKRADQTVRAPTTHTVLNDRRFSRFYFRRRIDGWIFQVWPARFWARLSTFAPTPSVGFARYT
jgi:hypothetical protein